MSLALGGDQGFDEQGAAYLLSSLSSSLQMAMGTLLVSSLELLEFSGVLHERAEYEVKSVSMVARRRKALFSVLVEDSLANLARLAILSLLLDAAALEARPTFDLGLESLGRSSWSEVAISVDWPLYSWMMSIKICWALALECVFLDSRSRL